MDRLESSVALQIRLDLLGELVRRIGRLLDIEKLTLSNRELLGVCRESGELGVVDPHFFHELAEVALNVLIADKYGSELLDRVDPEVACERILRPLQARLPTQTWRSQSQIAYQQFSTPAPIAYLMAYLLNLKMEDVVLEPSCGTGNLAAWAIGAGATVIANEVDPRRAELARLIGLEPTQHNAEHMDDLLPASLIPNVVMMNPPFSSNGGRTRTNSAKFGFRHVESALRRLAPGGRFGVILGANGSPTSRAGSEFWEKLTPEIEVFKSIEIDGREYYRNGTSVNVVLIVGRKLSNNEKRASQHVSVRTIEEAFSAIRSPNLFI